MSSARILLGTYSSYQTLKNFSGSARNFSVHHINGIQRITLYLLPHIFADIGIGDDCVALVIETQDDEAAFCLTSGKKPYLQYRGNKYKRALKLGNGYRWNCAVKRNCGAYLCSDKNNKIVSYHLAHNHVNIAVEDFHEDKTAIMINSRKGKELILFNQYTYRRQYTKNDKIRWVCSTTKNCKASLITDQNNEILKYTEDHCHEPPKYYLKPDNVLDALREPLLK